MKKSSCIIPLATSIFITSLLALSAHALIIQYFKAPRLNIDPSFNQPIGFIIRFLTVLSSFFIYLLSKSYWEKIKPFYRALLFFLLIMVLTEQLFRSPIMNIIVGTPLPYQLISTIQSYATFLIISLFVCFFTQFSDHKKFIFRYILFSALITLLTFFFKKLSSALLLPLLSLAPQPELSKIVSPPYPMTILLPAYITFLEPTIASFSLFYIIKNEISSFKTSTRGLILGGILIMIHGGIYSIPQIIYSKGNILYRIFYYGQYLWEYLTLGILTAYSFLITKRNMDSFHPIFNENQGCPLDRHKIHHY